MDDARRGRFLEELAKITEPGTLTTDAADLAELGRDWTRVYAPRPLAVTRPRSSGEVARIVRLASASGVAIVPSGGRTGLAGGAVAKDGELVVSLSRMTRMDAVDAVGRTLRVEAGAITEAVHAHAATVGLTWPVDFASKGSSTVGGNISTNAGGIKVLRYGLTRQWVLGLDVVLANGDEVTIGGALEKDNTGIDLRQLFIGSEGTLGIVTAAVLKLARLPKASDVLLFALRDLAGVVRLFREACQGPFTLSAFEFFTDKCLARLTRHRGLVSPLSSAASHYVVMEAERESVEASEAWLTSLFERQIVDDGTMAQHPGQARALWDLREGISESLAATGTPHKNDIALPVRALEDFTRDMEALLGRRYPAFEVCLFGHIGDGNLHVNVMKPDDLAKEAFLAQTSDLDHAMFELVRRHGGSISAEHGIGLLKKPYLGYSRSPVEIEMMRSVKRALDPKGIMNPHKVFDP